LAAGLIGLDISVSDPASRCRAGAHDIDRSLPGVIGNPSGRAQGFTYGARVAGPRRLAREPRVPPSPAADATRSNRPGRARAWPHRARARSGHLAGDESFTLADLAAEVSRQTGKVIVFKNLPQADYAAALAQFGPSRARRSPGRLRPTARSDVHPPWLDRRCA
jgi:uncharacterized protein YbjT (DUF2867 family)